ncbi:MAG: efflux RND transporter permease subunit [Fibrobacterota bacterium]
MITPDKIVTYLAKHRKNILIATLLGTLFFAVGLTRLTIDNDTMKSVPDTLTEKQNLKKLRETFDAPFNLLLLVEFTDSSRSFTERMNYIDSLSAQLSALQIDSSRAILNSTHLGTLFTPRRVSGFIPSIEAVPLIPQDTNLSDSTLHTIVQDHSNLTASLVSQDLQAFSLVLDMNPDLRRPRIVDKAVSIVRRENNRQDLNCYITSGTAMSYFISEKTKSDFTLLLPLCLALSTVLLFLVFRRILYVAISLFVILIAVIWTFGTMGWVGIPLSVVTSVIPIILFPIGVADSIHLLKTFSRFRWRQKMDFTRALTQTYRELLRPIVLTSITTFIGFGSFIFSDISWTRYFGLFTGMGVMLALLFSVLLLPIFLYYEREHPGKYRVEKDLLSHRQRSRITWMIFKSPLPHVLLLLVIITAVLGIPKIYFETNPIAMFSKDSDIVQSDRIISQQFRGTRFFNVLLTTREGDLTDLERWREIDSIVTYIKDIPEVGNVFSALPVLKETSRELTGKDFSSSSVKLLIQRADRLDEHGQKLLRNNITEDNKTIKLTVVCKNIPDPAFDYRDLAGDIHTHVQNSYTSWTTLEAGPSLLTNAMLDLLVDTQVSSLLLAIFFVFLILMLLYRSLRIGFYTTLPILLSTVTTYALMGIFGVSINLVTVIVMNTCIGIGIDYAIHFSSGFLFYRRTESSNMKALIRTIFNKGSVILFNTIVVGSGFLVLIFSNFPPIRSFGLFIFISMIISAVFSIVFLPFLFRTYNGSINRPTPEEMKEVSMNNEQSS